MQLKHITDIIESVAPLSQQEAWDNSGLQIGHNDADIASVLLCTDVTEAVIDEAVERRCRLVISHHPLFFHGQKTFQGLTPQQRVAEKAIRAGVAVYSSHTAMDVALHGVSGHMAERLGIAEYRILAPTLSDTVGLGVIGDLPEALHRDAFLQRVQRAFNAPCVRYTMGHADAIRRVALCGGAGAEFVDAAVAQGADAFISADFRHHEFADNADRVMLLDIGHFESEQFTKEVFRRLLEGHGLELLDARADVSPVKVFVGKEN